MKTAQEMVEIMNEARNRMKEASQLNAQIAVEKYLMPQMRERANAGYGCIEITLKNIVADRAVKADYIAWTETTGGWTRKRNTSYKVYVNDMVDFLKSQGYDVVYMPWMHLFTIIWTPLKEQV